jgi:hypothetical protein
VSGIQLGSGSILKPIWETKPVVVADWSWLRARNCNQLSNRVAWMVPEVVFREVTSSDDPERDLRKLRRIIIENHERLLLGRYWSEISLREDSTEVRSRTEHLVHPEMTLVLRALASQSESEWLEGLDERLRHGRDLDYEARRQILLLTSEQFAAWIHEREPDWERSLSTPERRRDWIRQPDHPVEWVARETPRMNTDEWKTALCQFPDQLAAGRWARSLIWTCLRRSIGWTRRLENDWDDAHYAFLASYTGQFATKDRGLAEMVQAVFPSVEIQGLDGE